MGKKTFDKCYISNAGHDSSWKPNHMGTRIRANGGVYVGNKIEAKTTHLVVTPKAWKAQKGPVKQALELNRDTDRDIKIVSFDWLDDTWRNEKKNNATFPYEWTKLDPKANSTSNGEDRPRKTQENASRKSSKENEGPKSHVGMVAEAFYDSTDRFVDEKSKKEMDKKIEQHRRVQKSMEEEEKAAKKAEEAKKAAASFQKGAKQARNDTFSENHHIYTDDTGFKYDVLITKVDTKHNRNERWALTIYESNAEPHTYTMNAQFASTIMRPSNNVLAAIGCPFETAFHTFKKTFKEKTNVNWNDRISFHLERTRQEKRNRGRGTGSEEGTQKGVPVSESGAAMNGINNDEDFATAYFQYHPPAYGPRGTLSERETQRIAALNPPTDKPRAKDSAVHHEKVDAWMSRANGEGPDTPLEGHSLSSSVCQGGAVQEAQSADIDVDAIFGSLDVENGDNTYNNGESINFNMFDYPFDNHDSLLAGDAIQQDDHQQQSMLDFGTDENDLGQQAAVDAYGTIFNSFQPGTQTIDETQFAEKARGEYMEDIEKPKPNLGSSILGKRKTSPQEDLPENAKVARLAEVEDSLAGEDASKVSAEDPASGTGDFHGLFQEEENEAAAVADEPSEQLLNEAVNADESVIELGDRD